MKFYSYLSEKWKYSRDQDYMTGGNSVIVFDQNDDYKISGYTHGLKSHAIKHGMEFNKSHYENILKKMEDYVKSTVYYIINRGGKITNGNLPFIGKNILINTMDRISDKELNGGLLTDQERYIFDKFIKQIKDKYYETVKLIEKNSTDITDTEPFNIPPILDKSLCVRTKDGLTIYFNLKTLHFGIKEQTGKPSTFYINNNKDKLLRKLKSFDYETDIMNTIL